MPPALAVRINRLALPLCMAVYPSMAVVSRGTLVSIRSISDDGILVRSGTTLTNSGTISGGTGGGPNGGHGAGKVGVMGRK